MPDMLKEHFNPQNKREETKKNIWKGKREPWGGNSGLNIGVSG